MRALRRYVAAKDATRAREWIANGYGSPVPPDGTFISRYTYEVTITAKRYRPKKRKAGK